MTSQQINSMKKAFRITVAALAISDAVDKECGGPGLDEKGLAMLALHKEALSELEKESPDADTIKRLLEKMENSAAQAVPKFPPGGISDGWLPNDLSPGARVISSEENDANKKAPA